MTYFKQQNISANGIATNGASAGLGDSSGDLLGAAAADPTRGSLLSSDCYARYGHRILLAYCLTAALSIAAAQSLLLALIAYWLLVSARGSFRDLSSASDRRATRVLSAPMAAWFVIQIITAICGIDPARSLTEAVKSSVFLLLPFAVAASFASPTLPRKERISRLETYIAAFLLGQSVAALHTILSELTSYELPSIVPGAVTESGQLVLIIPLVLGSAFYALTADSLKDNLRISIFGYHVSPQLYVGTLFTALLVVAWPGAILLDDSAAGTVVFRLIALVAILALALPPLRRGAPGMKEKLRSTARTFHLELIQLVWPAAALLFAALLINLKRGPWFGVFAELAVLGYLLSKRFLFWSVALSFIVILSVSPARTRVENLDEHFAISGGRKEMWNLGLEIVQRHPLGVGMHNARYMRELDPAIPSTHRHMHNNLLNVTVETGWLGLSVYLWWMWSVFCLGFGMWRRNSGAKDRLSRQLGMIALCFSVALLGWQFAGTVEYNFGDGEIRLIALVYMGLLLTLRRFLLPGGYGLEAATSTAA
ncbi:MAG: O-antigen ligase family protein [Bdellovibrionota bacterium]